MLIHSHSGWVAIWQIWYEMPLLNEVYAFVDEYVHQATKFARLQ